MSKWIRRGRLLLATALGLALAACSFYDSVATAAGNSGKFYNPIKNIGNDPFVAQKDGYYYHIESWDGGIWITKSAHNSLTDIESAGTRVKVWNYPTSGPNCSGIWAPELHWLNGKWYIYYAGTTCDNNNANHRMFVLESDTADALGTYTDKGKITDSTDKWAIDGTVFEYDDQLYFVWSGWPEYTDGQQYLYIAPMSNPWTVTGSRTLIAVPTLSWETAGMPVAEGPQVLVRNGTVNIVYSASGSWTDDYGYGLLTNTTSDMLNPANWIKKPVPVFSKTSDVFGPGHGSFVLSPDGTEDWMIYHSARRSGSGWDRIMNAQKFAWNADDTPNFGTPVSPHVRQNAPSGEPSRPDYGWGDSASGTAQFGNWTHLSASSIRSETLGAPWRQAFTGNVTQTNYTVTAEAKWLQSGTVSAFPKYGIYAAYKDANNYVLATIDVGQSLLATYGVVNGVSQAWQDSPLSIWTNPGDFNEISVVKDGHSFYFHVNGQLLQIRQFAIDNGQVGVMTEDVRAEFANVAVSANAARHYKLANKKSGRVASAEGGGTVNGTKAVLRDFANGDGYARILNKKSGRALSILDGGTANGSVVHLWDYWTTYPDQHWAIAPGSVGYVKLSNGGSGRVLSTYGGGTANGTPLHLWDYLGGYDDQDWTIELIP